MSVAKNSAKPNRASPVFCVTRPDVKPDRPNTQTMLIAAISTIGAQLPGKCLRASIVVLRQSYNHRNDPRGHWPRVRDGTIRVIQHIERRDALMVTVVTSEHFQSLVNVVVDGATPSL